VTVPMRLAQRGDAWAEMDRRRVDLLAWRDGLMRRAG
jgi:hypothetical protein